MDLTRIDFIEEVLTEGDEQDLRDDKTCDDDYTDENGEIKKKEECHSKWVSRIGDKVAELPGVKAGDKAGVKSGDKDGDMDGDKAGVKEGHIKKGKKRRS